MKKSAYINLILSMSIFGTIGLFVKFVDTPRGFLAMTRGFIGALFLLVFFLITKRKIDFKAFLNNAALLVISGAAIGFNWILLFESYSYTTVATSTLCYYMAPVFTILFSPFVLRERVSLKRWICVIFALFGMTLVSGVLDGEVLGSSALFGVLLALGAALLYASVTIMNKKLKEISSFDRTLWQLLFASLVLVPYTFIFEEVGTVSLDWKGILVIVVLGVLHTGLAYALFFSSVEKLSAHTVAIFSYIDPVLAVVLSALVLKEEFTVFTAIGAVIILVSTLVSELNFGKRAKEKK